MRTTISIVFVILLLVSVRLQSRPPPPALPPHWCLLSHPPSPALPPPCAEVGTSVGRVVQQICNIQHAAYMHSAT